MKAGAVSGGRTLEMRSAIVLAAREVLLENGYAGARVEDIIKRAGISRPTFYRHFKDKFEVAAAYHAIARGESMGPWSRITEMDFRDIADIRQWLEELLDYYQGQRSELMVWAEMSAVEPDYLRRVPRLMPDQIDSLAQSIPAFAKARSQAPAGNPADMKSKPGPVWVEAFLLLEQIALHCTWIVLGRQLIAISLSLDSFAERVLRFIERYDDPSPAPR